MIITLHLQNFTSKSWKPPLSQNSPAGLSYSLLPVQWSHITHLMPINLGIMFATTSLCYPCYAFEYVTS